LLQQSDGILFRRIIDGDGRLNVLLKQQLRFIEAAFLFD
jgi:hypothetical protein